MTEINLRYFEKSLIDAFRRYLFTLNLISDNERDLRDAFWDALMQKDIFQREPLLSAIPAYDTAESAQALIGRQIVPKLNQKLNVLSADRFDVTRPLYNHQIKALQLIQQKKNAIVATGTGSGKTECFLLPLLDDALQKPGPGVRAIVIYPMNALANDQLSRMRELLQPIPEITFGRYTGDTPLDRTNISDSDKAAILEPNERFSRISTPPRGSAAGGKGVPEPLALVVGMKSLVDEGKSLQPLPDPTSTYLRRL